MRDKIKAAIQGSHRSIINGIDSDLATDKVEKLFKDELRKIFNEIQTTDYPYDVVYFIKKEYGIES